mmetsp:Transcript_59027/g.167499  ORF Transcript_59027/g.167499 Transcript_59027/m.167499 type:complete len:223 (-) Transcript_59027:61-729(-)
MQLIMSASTGSAPSTLACSAYSARRAEEVPQLHLDPVAHLAPQQNATLARSAPIRYRASKSQLDGNLDLEQDSRRLRGDLFSTSSSYGEDVSFSFADVASLRHELQMELTEPEGKIDDDLHHMSGGLASTLRARRGRKVEDVVAEPEDIVRTVDVPSSGSAPVSLVPTPPSHPRLNSRPALGARTSDKSAATQPETMPAPPSQPRQGNPAPRQLPGSAVVHR